MDQQEIELALSFDDVLIVPAYSEIQSRSLVDLTTQLTPKVKLQLPLLSTNMNDVTGLEMALALGKLGGMGLIPRFESPDIQADMVSKVKKAGYLSGAAVGVKSGFMDRAEALVRAGADLLLLDVAHGHMKQTAEATTELKNKFGKKADIVAGAVATAEAAEDLFKAGADCVRVGVGPGSICITRIVTGVGVPQVTAITEASRIALKHKKTVLADGGMKNSGDVAKALACGAHAVTMGNVFAGTDEAPGETVTIGDRKYKVYNGSTSPAEKSRHVKNLKKGSISEFYLNHIEGVQSYVPYKGPVENIMTSFAANLKSAFSYVGAKNIEEFHKNAKFVKVTTQGMRESGAHDVVVKD